jgi:hypothetical protein
MLRRSLRSLLVLCALAAALVAVPASAAPPAASTACSSPTLSGPSSVRVGDAYTVSGCGFAPGSMIGLEVAAGGGCCLALNVAADDAGRISYSDTAYSAGTYRVRAVQRVRNKVRVVAEWSFTAS